MFCRFYMQNQGFIIAREGFKFILIGLGLTLLSVSLGWDVLATILGGFTLFVVFFFRNPNRQAPNSEGLIISPADGTICKIEDVHEKRFLKEPRKRVSIFMSVFNCHVNRFPVNGKVIDTQYNPGKFHMAMVDKASDLNEQHTILLEDNRQNRYVVVQIAGLIARRIVSYVTSGDTLKVGQRFGLIQFGSRVDLYLPKNAAVRVKVGEKVKGGETVLGNLL